MDTELHNRLKEAAENYADDIATTEERGWMDRSDIYAIAKDAHLVGAEFGYKEAIKMAEWKDQHLKEYLEEKRKELIHKRYNEVIESPYDFGNIEGQIDAVSLIINELFKEE